MRQKTATVESVELLFKYRLQQILKVKTVMTIARSATKKYVSMNRTTPADTAKQSFAQIRGALKIAALLLAAALIATLF